MSEIEAYIKDLPSGTVTKDDIIKAAESSGASARIIGIIRDMPDVKYSTYGEIDDAYRDKS